MALAKKTQVFVLGAGFIGAPLAENLKKAGYEVAVSVRSKVKKEDFESKGFTSYNFEVGQEGLIPSIRCESLIISYPLGGRRMENQEFLLHAHWIEKNFKHTDLKQVILTSSTSVYPDGFGEVDENCTHRPKAHGVNQLAFEEALRAIFGDKLTVLRLAGLVGANRNPGRFLAGRTEVPNAFSPVNMVHQMDVVRVIELVIKHWITNEIYNLCHPKHPTRIDYYQNTAKKLALIPPQFSKQQIENPKIVSNAKSLTLNNFAYQWPI
jgi:nucleoside-diphosphate-sugar epimerase